ncbi:MAG: aldolase/citrate lyase family protein [Ghiorsea sp.]|nr:aldolase/citrate lyase family protein [Ghiorsea sp.]
MMQYMYITNDPQLAKIIVQEGVQRIFIDWEVLGKQERQGHLDTVMSKHTYEDAVLMRKAVPEAELMVRLNPMHEGTAKEVEKAISAGADLLMLPMFYSVEEVRTLSEMVDGRVGIVPLFETPESLRCVESIAALPSIHEIYIGLNDLHLALGLDFMFEPLVSGMLDDASACAKKAGLRFGFGGVARADEGDVSGAMVLGEHLRLGSNSVILSRTFYRADEDKESAGQVFQRELKKLRNAEETLKMRDKERQGEDFERFAGAVMKVVALKREKQAC